MTAADSSFVPNDPTLAPNDPTLAPSGSSLAPGDSSLGPAGTPRPGPVPGKAPIGVGRALVAGLRRNRLMLAGLVVLVLMVGFCFLGPVFYHSDQTNASLADQTLPPGPGHPLGTDAVGYDQLGRLMLGGQSAIEIGLGAALLAVVLGTAWGAVAGYFGGAVDAMMMRVVDAMLAIPAILLLLVLSTIWHPSVPKLIVILGLLAWLGPARFVRGETLTIRVRDYVKAARLMGARAPRIIVRHVLPNTVGTIMVNATFQVADAILAVATLSYLGLGLPPPAATWGGMLSSGLDYVQAGYWWLVYPPGIAIVLVVAAFYLIGDGLREIFDARLRTLR
ncbi:ABC transporter permease [Catenulispora yoronensis]|uniref:ABC transporter permease n=1 Tax=Catenulispora yoronensis TaxID=450799 RepID=A0ABN2TPV5_9ACTN